MFRYLLTQIVDRDKKAIASVCEEHRNPLKFNVCIVELFRTARLLSATSKRAPLGLAEAYVKDVLAGRIRE